MPIAFLFALLVTAVAVSAQTTRRNEPPKLDPRLTALELPCHGPFVRNGAGEILGVGGTELFVSADEGKTWTSRPLFGEKKLKARPEQAFLRTNSGALVFLFLDDLDKRWKWNNETNRADGDVWIHVWRARSTDDGKTWDFAKVQDGYCGAIRDLIQTKDGNLVTPLQIYLTKEARHAATPHVSTDDGVTFKPAGVLDGGGRGHHDGTIEPTVVELRDGRLWMILRSNSDYFWQAHSTDGGLSWHDLKPTTIDASSAPAIVKRLESGRLAMLWNRLGPADGSPPKRRSGQNSERQASWFREELSMAFSEDDGKTWSAPIVVARGQRLAYPYLFERKPGVLWITTMFGGLRAEAKEADLLGKAGD